MPRGCWAGCRPQDTEEVPGETPDMGILLPRAGEGPCLILTRLLYFDRLFVQCQARLLCLLLIFVFPNGVCFTPLAPLPVPCRGSPRGPPRCTVALPHRGDGDPPWSLAPLPHPGGQLRQEMREKPQQKRWFSEERKYVVFSCVSPSSKRSLALDARSCEGNHPPPALFNSPPLLLVVEQEKIKSSKKGTRRVGGCPSLRHLPLVTWSVGKLQGKKPQTFIPFS